MSEKGRGCCGGKLEVQLPQKGNDHAPDTARGPQLKVLLMIQGLAEQQPEFDETELASLWKQSTFS